MPVETALAILRSEAGEHLASDVIEALVATLD
jgi:HD-GYP domain-containing protein (c-di-GMP phosphodiesterase class II)